MTCVSQIYLYGGIFMRYTSRRYAGLLCVALSIAIISRFIPAWLWMAAVLGVTAAIMYLLYNYIFN